MKYYRRAQLNETYLCDFVEVNVMEDNDEFVKCIYKSIFDDYCTVNYAMKKSSNNGLYSEEYVKNVAPARHYSVDGAISGLESDIAELNASTKTDPVSVYINNWEKIDKIRELDILKKNKDKIVKCWDAPKELTFDNVTESLDVELICPRESPNEPGEPLFEGIRKYETDNTVVYDSDGNKLMCVELDSYFYIEIAADDVVIRRELKKDFSNYDVLVQMAMIFEGLIRLDM